MQKIEKSEQVALLSFLNNVALVAIKYTMALLSGSTALIADAIHSLTDVIGSVTLWIGLKVSKRRSKSFPYGLYKVENLVALLTSFAIFFAGYEILHEVFSSDSHKQIEHLPFAIGAVVVSIFMTFIFSRYELRVGKSLNSPSLIADGEHIRCDLFSSLVILIGLAGNFIGLNLDRIAAVVVVVFIIRAGADVAISAIRVLLDASIDFGTLDQVKSVLLKEPKVKTVLSLTGRNSGRYKFIEIELTLRERDLTKAHAISKRLEDKVREQINGIDHILIHYEPVAQTEITCAVPLADIKTSISLEFGEAPFFAIFKIDIKKAIIFDEVISPNQFLHLERAKGIEVAEWLVKKNVDVLFTKKQFPGKGPTYVFSDAGVEVKELAEAIHTYDDVKESVIKELVTNKDKTEYSENK